MHVILNEKYKNPEDIQNYNLGKIYLKKLCTNFFKMVFYFVICVISYNILKQLDYFPVSLGGNGDMKNLFVKGYPDFYFHWKPEYFDIYYLVELSYCLTDLVWLVFIYELQTDFILMLFHHTCTISLISFSFLTNYTNIGCLVLFLHDSGDILVYFTRILINSNLKNLYVLLIGLCLTTFFIYTRLVVFGQLISLIWNGIPAPWCIVTTCLWGFLTFLYIIHINWVYLLLKKIYVAIFQNKIEDTHNVNIDKKN
jgi:hypothetical protein